MTVNVADAKAKFSSLLATAGLGKEEVVISKRDKPVAVLVSYDAFVKMQAQINRQIEPEQTDKLPSSLDKYIGIVAEEEIDYGYKESREQYLADKYL